MKIIELKGKRLALNGGGHRVPGWVVAVNGDEYSIHHAGRTIFWEGAVFTYNGAKVTDLGVLPEC